MVGPEAFMLKSVMPVGASGIELVDIIYVSVFTVSVFPSASTE